MRCAQVGPLVERYVDGALDEARASEVAAHAAGCGPCRARIAAAQAVRDALAAEPAIRAPRGFSARVMDAVYREALTGAPFGPRAGEPIRAVGAGRMYRRLGLSFLLTAGVLAASLLIPRVAYPSLAESGLSQGKGVVVRSALDGADTAVRGILREQGNGGNSR